MWLSKNSINFYFSQISADYIADLHRINKLKISTLQEFAY